MPQLFDTAILTFLHSHATPFLNITALLLTQLGGPVFIPPATILIALGFYRRNNRQAANFILYSGVGSALLNSLLKLLFQRQRPELWDSIIHLNSYSFPSGHAMASTTLALSLIVVFWETRWRRPTIIAGFTYALVVGITRIYLGVHYPSDVLAGWSVSLLWVLLMRTLFWKNQNAKTQK